MARGGARKNLADLIDAVGDQSPVDGARPQPNIPVTSAPLVQFVANPRNPRDDLGDLSDLASIAEGQLQPALVVTRGAYLALYPDDATAVESAQWVVINGCRRLAAARKYGCAELEFIVKDEIASTQVRLLSASITENIARQDFDVIEEAKAVEALVEACGTAEAAAAQLKKTGGWVSQRRALLNLAPELQAALRRGDLAIRLARSLARVPLEDQVAKWQAEQARKENEDTNGEDAGPLERPPVDAPRIAKALKRFGARPDVLADAISEYMEPDQLRSLILALTATLESARAR
ncbi:ParB/RepB/Spo0J family partition protein [Nocardia sp. NPDC050408]|uniref:ParB/RepB/Spo0J family partition protein n=1 Tax=Nocardia sp. NPDC050408 TaxID=3364319 RepID=UPI0037A42A1B